MKRFIKRIVTWLYARVVKEIYIPPFENFSIGLGGCERANAKHWNSFLPDTLVIHVRNKDGRWYDRILRQ